MADLANYDELNVRQIPKFEFEVNNEELRSCIKELAFNLKTQDKYIQKLKKELEGKTSESQITQAFVFINSLIQIDPSISKLLKSKQAKKQDLTVNPINGSSSELGRKINQISESMSLINTGLKNLQKKVGDLQFNTKSSLNEKSNTLQEQIDDINSKIYNQVHDLNEKIQLSSAQFGDKVREVETKTVWQINDCKVRLNSCINEQFVKDAIREVEGKMATKMKEQSIKQGAIDPERIQKIQQQINKNQKQFNSSITETNYKISTLKQSTEKKTLSKQEYAEEKIEIQKRFGHLNNNLADLIRRLKHNETDISDHKEKINKFQEFDQFCSKQITRMGDVLKNLQIGEDFQKMLEKIDPHKICELDNRVDDLTLENQKLNKYFDLLKREMERVRSKTEFCNILTPNSGGTGEKMSKQEIQEIIHEYMVNNMFAKKIQSLESQIIEVKAFPEMVNDINKKLARMQKETDNHNLIYQIRGLQEYVKKENLIINNRINQVQNLMNSEKKQRPSSASKYLGQTKMSSSISYKKLTPVSCISCYPSERKSLVKKF